MKAEGDTQTKGVTMIQPTYIIIWYAQCEHRPIEYLPKWHGETVKQYASKEEAQVECDKLNAWVKA